MTTPTGPSASERFLERITPKPRKSAPKDTRVTEDAEFLQMLWRHARALERRAIERPENLLQVLALVQRMNEIVNVAIAVNADRYKADVHSGASMAECARALGISDPSASGRRKIGNRIIDSRLDAANATRIDKRGRTYEVSAEVAREQDAIATAADAAVVAFVDFLARRRAA